MIFKNYIKSKEQLQDLKELLIEEFKKRLDEKNEELIKLIDFTKLDKLKEEENLEWLYYNFIRVIDANYKKPLSQIQILDNKLLEQEIIDNAEIKITRYSGALAKAYLGFKYKNCLKKNTLSSIFGSFYYVVYFKTSKYKNKILCSGESLQINDLLEREAIVQAYYIHDNSNVSTEAFQALEDKFVQYGVLSDYHNVIFGQHESYKLKVQQEEEKRYLKELGDKYNIRKKILGF